MPKKKQRFARITIDMPDDKWARMVEATGETEPRKVVEAVLKWYIDTYGKKEPSHA